MPPRTRSSAQSLLQLLSSLSLSFSLSPLPSSPRPRPPEKALYGQGRVDYDPAETRRRCFGLFKILDFAAIFLKFPKLFAETPLF